MHTEEQNTNPVLRDRSPNAVALDNLVRRKLRVSDPSNAAQVAEALRKLYLAESQALDQEAAGLPFVRISQPPTSVETQTASRAELKEAMDDVHRDLTSLSANALLKDIYPELNGWSTAIRSAIAEGTNAARYSLDPRQRDKAFGVRRLLGGYARVARYVGALTPTQSLPYRKLAQSLDEVASVILVMMGDSLANIGYSGGRFLLQAPASELQSRRDAVIYALRNLVGSTQQGFAPNEWPRGLVAYRQFLHRLDESGQADLRSVFTENHVARVMDDLIHWTTNGDANDLRALASTSHLALEQFKRLVRLGQTFPDPESPPLSSFLSAIQLFVDAFLNAASGHRLPYISRPPIVFYGLYGFGDLDDGTKRLLALVQARGNLANKLDCYLGCDCSRDVVQCQIQLDKILYDMDRAIDLYALGSDPQGEGKPEQRAASYGFLIDQFLKNGSCTSRVANLEQCLITLRNILWWANPADNSPRTFVLGERTLAESPESPASVFFAFRLRISNDPPQVTGFPQFLNDSVKFGAVTEPEVTLKNALITVLADINEQLDQHNLAIDPTEVPTEPSEAQTTLQSYVEMFEQMHQELCLQQDIENEWQNLLETMAPSCIRFNDPNNPEGKTINATKQLIADAITEVNLGQLCPKFEVDIPPHYETSLQSLVEDTDRTGGGRTGI